MNFAVIDLLPFGHVLLPIFVVLTSVILVVLTLTWASTTLQFRRALSKGSSGKGNEEPVTIPYTIPWLGSALSFLNEQSAFYASIRAKVEKASSICKVRLGPQTSYIMLAPSSVEGMFKNHKDLSTDAFVRMLELNAFGFPPKDVDRANERYTEDTEDGGEKGKQRFPQQPHMHRHLLNQAAATALSTRFVEVLKDGVHADRSVPAKGEWATLDLYTWYQDKMFIASTTALFGSRLLEMCPEMSKDLWTFDAGILRLTYGTLRFLALDVYSALNRLLDGIGRWVDEGWPKNNQHVDATQGEDWEPVRGSRFIRAQQNTLATAGLSTKGRAGMALAFLFGLSSNAIPAAAWMLFHILSSPKDLLPRMLSEISTAQKSDGTLDYPKLMSLPLLSSTYMEMLRMYTAVNVTREVMADCVIDGHSLKKGNAIMAPTWIGHRDPEVWNALHSDHPPPETFYADRFLRQEGDKVVCSMAGLAGKWFPYGGGAHMCPGRAFAKQEILAAVATVLLGYDIEFVAWVNPYTKDKTVRFPEVRKGYVGNGIIGADRDMRVRIRRKT